MCTFLSVRSTFLKKKHALTRCIFCRSIECFICFSSFQALIFCRPPKKGRPNQEKKRAHVGDCSNWPQTIPKGPIPIPKVGPTLQSFGGGPKGQSQRATLHSRPPSTAGRAEREMPTHHAHDTCSGQLVRWSSRQRTQAKTS